MRLENLSETASKTRVWKTSKRLPAKQNGIGNLGEAANKRSLDRILMTSAEKFDGQNRGTLRQKVAAENISENTIIKRQVATYCRNAQERHEN